MLEPDSRFDADDGFNGGNDPFPENLILNDFNTQALAKCDIGTEGSLPKACIQDNAEEGEVAWEDGDAPGDYSSAFTLNYFQGDDGVAFNWEFDPLLVSGVPESDVLFPHYVAVKQSNFFDVWVLGEDERLGGTIDTEHGDVSHVSFYNTGAPSQIPLPAAGWLLLAGIGGLAAFRRRKSV